MTSRDQITIPSEIREKLDLHPGNKFAFLVQDGQIIMMPINRSIKSLKVILPKPDYSLSCAEIQEIIKDTGKA